MYGKVATVSAGSGGAVLAYTGFNGALGLVVGLALLVAGLVLLRLGSLHRQRHNG